MKAAEAALLPGVRQELAEAREQISELERERGELQVRMEYYQSLSTCCWLACMLGGEYHEMLTQTAGSPGLTCHA